MTTSPLADLTVVQVSERLEGYGSTLEGEAKEAIHSLLKALESGLMGTLENAYHLSAIDPGLGKSLAVAMFLRTWKAKGFVPPSSVLIGLSRLSEIPKYLDSAGLDREDVAILTSDGQVNGKGVPEAKHGSAPIMFTSQQMIERRTRGQSFAEAAEFHFQGRPRGLRIWDESLIPAEPLILRADLLASLPAVMRRLNPESIASLQRFLSKLWQLKDRGRITVPEDFARLFDTPKGKIGQDNHSLLDALRRLSGRPVALVEAGKGDMYLAGSSTPLPSDFAPAVILDASGRVRETYRVWERERGTLRRLPEAVKDYSNLDIHLWEHAVGKEAVAKPGVLPDVVRAIADVIDNNPEEDWLVVHYKDHPVDDLLRAGLKHDLGDRLHFLHWGNHHGTNEFADCRNVVLIGQLTYGAGSYLALSSACGVKPSRRTRKLEQAMKDGEYRHNMLQALTRAHVRRSKGGLAGTCKAFIIASPRNGAEGLIQETFPGCSIVRWMPKGPEANGKAGALIALFKEAAARGGVRELVKKDLRETLDMNAPNFARLLTLPAVGSYIAQNGINVSRHSVIIRGVQFSAYEGEGYEGGFSVEDLGGS